MFKANPDIACIFQIDASAAVKSGSTGRVCGS